MIDTSGPNQQVKSLTYTLNLRLGQFNFSKQQVQKKIDKKQLEHPSFKDFFKKTIPDSWSFPKHIELICQYLQDLYDDKFDRLIITMPPRHSKSETTTVRFGAFYLENNPENNVLITSYNERQARRFSRKCRTVFTSRNQIEKSKTATDEWSTKNGGVLLARGIGSPITGTGASLIIADDTIRSREDAESSNGMDKMWDWWISDVLSRLEPKGKIVICQTRWTTNDLIGRVLEAEPDRWKVLNLPAIAEEEDLMGRLPGEALWPERYNIDDFNKLKKVIGDYQWNSVYQCNPVPREGAWIMTGNLKIIDTAPNNLKKIIRSWDLASTKDGDYTAGVKMGIDNDNNIFILDVSRGQWTVDERDSIIKQTAALDGKITITIPQDPGAAGKAQITYLSKMLSGFPIKTTIPNGSKQIRAEPIAAQINVGNVYLVKGNWNRDYIEELRQFPLGKNDDQVDATSDAYNNISINNKWTAI